MFTQVAPPIDNQAGDRLIRRQKNILIADDNETVLAALEHHLKESDFTVYKAYNGKEALQLSLDNPIDIIISDIGMPEMDGLELCEKVRENPKYFDVPFIFLTAHGGEKDRIRGYRSGADEYIVKPFKMEELVARVEILYDRVRQKRSQLAFTGNLKEVALYEVLQLFELTRKRGVLHIDNSRGIGGISFADGTIMDAFWNKTSGEDALVEMFSFKEGNFRFEPKDVSAGSIMKPLSFILMETARLMDELMNVDEYIPEQQSGLALGAAAVGDEDQDGKLICQSIREGCSNLREIRDRLNVSDARLKLSVGRLIRAGCVIETRRTAGGERDDMIRGRSSERPHKVLIAFTDEEILLKCLALLSGHEYPSMKKSGFSDFCRITISSRVYNVFFLRGEKRYSFMWEPILRTSEASLFVLKTEKDGEHADFFSTHAAALNKPFMKVSFNEDCCSPGVRMIASAEEMVESILTLNKAAE